MKCILDLPGELPFENICSQPKPRQSAGFPPPCSRSGWRWQPVLHKLIPRSYVNWADCGAGSNSQVLLLPDLKELTSHFLFVKINWFPHLRLFIRIALTIQWIQLKLIFKFKLILALCLPNIHQILLNIWNHNIIFVLIGYWNLLYLLT